jgi:hypothetical protein
MNCKNAKKWVIGRCKKPEKGTSMRRILNMKIWFQKCKIIEKIWKIKLKKNTLQDRRFGIKKIN